MVNFVQLLNLLEKVLASEPNEPLAQELRDEIAETLKDAGHVPE